MNSELWEEDHEKSNLEVRYSALNPESNDQRTEVSTSTFRRYLNAWWMILLHVVLTVVLSVLALLVVDRRKFLVNGQKRAKSLEGSWLLYQSDMTTIISAALVAVRLSAASWLTLAKYRSMFMQLEKVGMTLEQISNALRYGFPGRNKIKRRIQAFTTSDLTGKRGSVHFVWLAVLIIIPIQLIGPLASGAFTWVPAQISMPLSPIAVAQAANGLGWQYLVDFSEHQTITTLQSAGLAALHTNARFESGSRPLLRNYLPSLKEYPIGATVLGSAVLPHFAIESFEWISDLGAITSSENASISSVFDSTNPNLSFGSDENPFVSPSDTYVTATTVALHEPWPKPPLSNDSSPYKYSFPQPHTLQQSLVVGVFVARNDSVAMMKDCYSPEDKFGMVSRDIALLGTTIEVNNSQALDNCYAFARVTFTAGVINCTDCPIAASATLEADMALPQYRNVKLLPDSLVSTAVHMIPETLMYITRMNSTAMPTWENLDGYAKGILSLTYQSCWNALQLKTLDAASNYSTSVTTSTSVVVAQVAATRIYIWLGLNLLILVSGAILIATQNGCKGEPVTDPQVYSLLLDSTAVTGSDEAEISDKCWNTGELTKRDREKQVRLIVPTTATAATTTIVEEESQSRPRRARLVSL